MSHERSRSKPSGLPIIHPFAAGIDIGSRFHVAAVSPDLCDEPVQTFQALPAIWNAWPLGSLRPEPKRSSWNRPACIGSPPSKYSSRTGWRSS
jgi:hypothetical protein